MTKDEEILELKEQNKAFNKMWGDAKRENERLKCNIEYLEIENKKLKEENEELKK